MSITAHCVCGKRYQVKEAAAGKKFKCKECDETVTVPNAELDELEDYDDDEEEEFRPAPAHRRKGKSQKSRPSAKSSKKLTSDNIQAFLLVPGFILGILGIILGCLYSLIGSILLAKIQPGGCVLMWLLSGLTIFGGRAAMGKGLQFSTGEPWKGGGSMIVGILMVGLGIVPVVVGIIFAANTPR